MLRGPRQGPGQARMGGKLRLVVGDGGFQFTEASKAQTLLSGEKQRGVHARECVGVKVL